MKDIKNIIAAIDFSKVTDDVVDTAAMFARSFSSHLWLIHIAAPDPDFVGYDVGPKHERDWRAVTLREEHKYIQAKAKELESSNISVTPLLLQGPTAETICKEANKLDADLIVFGSHGHSAIYSILVGSVAKELLKSLSCNLLVVPSK